MATIRHSERTIRKICRLLQDHPDWSYDKIAKLTGVTLQTVGAISRRQSRRKIGEDYYLDYHDAYPRGEQSIMHVCTTEQIEEVCRLLDIGGRSYKQIADMVGVAAHIVRDVYRGKSWRCVSKDYNFAQDFDKEVDAVGKG